MLVYDSPVSGREDNRRSLRVSEALQWVSVEEWQRLILSHDCLVRADHGKAGVRGLLNPVSGEQFVIEEELLFI